MNHSYKEDLHLNSTAHVILSKIHQLILAILNKLNDEVDPIISIPSNSITSISNRNNHHQSYFYDEATIAKPSHSSSSSSNKSICNLSTCRSYTSTLLLLSYIQKLVQCQKSTTTREIYYQFVTHFRNQRECESIINDICNMLYVERVQLGLYASPKGWFCGSFVITEFDTAHNSNHVDATNDGNVLTNVIDGTKLSSIQGIPITREWLVRSTSKSSNRSSSVLHDNALSSTSSSSSIASHKSNSSSTPPSPFNFTIQSNAKCILIIEKEGIYLRLSEDRFFDKYPCIIITGKGYPDIATRALVHVLHSHLGCEVPIYGLCDCNPFGVNILQTYFKGSEKRYCDGGERYSVPIQWVGLRPSYVMELKEKKALPDEVYQKLSDLDKKKIEKLCHESNTFVHDNSSKKSSNKGHGNNVLEELELMEELGFKVELESLHWLGLDYISEWLLDLLVTNEEQLRRTDKDDEFGDENTGMNTEVEEYDRDDQNSSTF